MLLLPGTALLCLRKAQSTPQTSLAVPQSDFFFFPEVIGTYVSSLWKILAVVLTSSVHKTADNIPPFFSPLKPSS